MRPRRTGYHVQVPTGETQCSGGKESVSEAVDPVSEPPGGAACTGRG